MFQAYPELQKKLIENIKEKENLLSEKAMKSFQSRGRIFPTEEDFRSMYMRDRDKIIHSASFRRMKDKAQVFLLSKNDMMRTRMTHTLEVSQVARTITVALNLNENLTEAIALGHDLGHTPFGHIGERAIKTLCSEWFSKSGVDFDSVNFLDSKQEWTHTPLRNFRHNIQSLRVVDFLENKGKGLNLTYEVRDGILKHSKWGGGILTQDPKYLPITLEGQIVRISDRIAYVNHDLEDAVRSGYLNLKDIPSKFFNILGNTHSERIGKAIISVVEYYEATGKIEMNLEIAKHIDELYALLGDIIYRSPRMNQDAEKASFLIHELGNFFLKNPEIILEKTADINYPSNTDIKQKIIDYIANMTDHFIIREFQKYRIPQSWAGF